MKLYEKIYVTLIKKIVLTLLSTLRKQSNILSISLLRIKTI